MRTLIQFVALNMIHSIISAYQLRLSALHLSLFMLLASSALFSVIFYYLLCALCCLILLMAVNLSKVGILLMLLLCRLWILWGLPRC